MQKNSCACVALNVTFPVTQAIITVRVFLQLLRQPATTMKELNTLLLVKPGKLRINTTAHVTFWQIQATKHLHRQP